MKNKTKPNNKYNINKKKKEKRVQKKKKNINNSNSIEIFPNLIININSEEYLSKQLHYIISRNLSGIFHHGSKDLINHEELIKLIISKLNPKSCNFKYVYTTNENRYLSLMSKTNKFPNHLNFSYNSVIKEIT